MNGVTKYDVDIVRLDGRLNVMDEKMLGMDKALLLQAGKDKEHMAELNHEKERVKAMENKFPDKESLGKDLETMRTEYRTQNGNLNDRMDRRNKEVDDKVEILTAWKNSIQGQTQNKSTLREYIPWLIAAAALAYQFFKK